MKRKKKRLLLLRSRPRHFRPELYRPRRERSQRENPRPRNAADCVGEGVSEREKDTETERGGWIHTKKGRDINTARYSCAHSYFLLFLVR